jgi:FKBP-type peptidyl-prolyl cis-trans isomerase FkpA
MMRIAMMVVTLIAAVTIAYTQFAPAKAQDAAWLQKQQAAIAALRHVDGWESLPGNLKWRRVEGISNGAHPTVSDTVTLHYTGKLIDGSVFDSSLGGEPATFPLNSLIKGWQIAVPKAAVGDTIEIAVPAALGYGERGAGPIPGGATLMFRIKLIAIVPKA